MLASPLPAKTFLPLLWVAMFFSGLQTGHGASIQVGDPMLEFTQPLAGEEKAAEASFSYRNGRGRVLILVFLQPQQEDSERALRDVQQTLASLPKQRERFDVVGVISVPGSPEETGPVALPKAEFPLVLDRRHRLRGDLGVMVSPTTVVVGADDRVHWIKPGYAYDFASGLLRQLSDLLNFETASKLDRGPEISVFNDTASARARRRLRLAKLLVKEKQISAAIDELGKARTLDPNNVDVLLTLGECYCQSDQAQEALTLLADLPLSNPWDQARGHLVSGWAYRLNGQVKQAESELVKATRLNPKSDRSFLELGRLYDAQGLCEEALAAYRSALALVFKEPLAPTRDSR